MRSQLDPQLKQEIERFRLRFQCDACAYFDATTKLCSEGYPNGEHRQLDLKRDKDVCFCKRFELV